MQVFGHGRRFARAASAAIRAEAAEGGEAAAFRRGILDRWHLARREGLTAGKAAEVVGVPRSTLFNWDRLRRQGRLEPRSRRPRRLRRNAWSAKLVKAVREARLDQPMWGKAKIAVAIRREGLAASESTVGRVLAHLVSRGSVEPVPAALPEVGVVRRHRMNAAGSADTPDLVDHESFPALPYEPGKVLISEGEASSGDPLPMRGFFPERIHDQSRSLGDSFASNITYLNQNSDLTEYDFFHAGLRVTGTGLVIEMGGKGSDGTDLRRQVWLAPNTGPSSVHFDGTLPGNLDPWGWDLVLTFGEPTPSPEGNGERYWAARLMPDPGQIADGADATTRARYLVDGRPYRVGTYNLWLSNHAGADLGLEPVGPGETYPDDDVNSHLKYAAYGMMTFASSDRFERTTSLGAHIRDRVQAFHAGYDAFEDKSGRRTTDIREAVSGGKFTGLTIALELDRISGGNVNDYGAIDVPAARRLRGEVELTATISGAASNNAVKGRIRNLEVWDSRGYWKDYASIADDIALGSGSIDADGQYDGTITGVAGFGDGEYGGSFYGPVSDLETAGAWFLHGTNQGADAVHRAIVGSFGAKHAPQSE